MAEELVFTMDQEPADQDPMNQEPVDQEPDTGEARAAKTGSTAAKKPAAKTESTTAKKKAASSSIRLSAAEKKLIENYRKCNDMTKTMISAVVEKIAGTKAASQTDQNGGQNQQDNGLLGNLDLGNLDLGGLLNLFGK